jgi:malate dehydrogenase (oxaloacetate-decarboxylating)
MESVSETCIIPSPLDRRVVPCVAEAVARAAIETGVANRPSDPKEVGRKAEAMIRLLEKDQFANS